MVSGGSKDLKMHTLASDSVCKGLREKGIYRNAKHLKVTFVYSASG